MPQLAVAGGLAAAVGGVASAAGSIAGGALAKPDKLDPQSSYYYPPSDPVVSGLSFEAMMGLGQSPSTILQDASPINQAINKINLNPGITDANKQVIIRVLADIGRGVSSPGLESADPASESMQSIARKALQSIGGEKGLNAIGYSLEDAERLIEQEFQYQQYARDVTSQYGEVQPGIFEGRLNTQEAIGNLMSEISGQYGGGTSPLVQQYMRSIEADVNRTYDKQMEDVMRMSNVAGFNPGRAISDLQDSKASALQNLQHTGTMQAGQIMSLLQGSLQPAQNTAATTASIRSGQGVGAAGVAGNQASAINSIQASINSQRAQAMGAGVAGAGQSVADSFLLSQLLSNDPGTSDNASLIDLMRR